MPSTFIFGCLELKRRSCKIPFPKSIVYSDLVLDKLGQSCMSFLPRKNELCKLLVKLRQETKIGKLEIKLVIQNRI